MNRRTFLSAGAASLALGLLGRVRAQGAPRARRLIVFYFPDGVAGPSAEGEASLWHPGGGEHDFVLGEQLQALAPYREHCVFFRGLTMGDTDNGSHPGGAKKLLTAVDGGQGESIDRLLARTIGADSPHRHVYLGAMANQDNASGDKHISYPAPGHTAPPEDDPQRAFARLFDAVLPGGGGGLDPAAEARRARRLSVLDAAQADLRALRDRLGAGERARLDLHADALREVERRTRALAPMEAPAGACDRAPGSVAGVRTGELYAPAQFPAILRAQTDLMVSAMACGLTRVGVIQASHHTSELIMSRFADSEMFDPGFDMRSHQASHYGPRHDRGHREFRDYLAQRRWFVAQFAYLLEQLRIRPEGEGTMLDHTLALLCTEVCDGNTHQHHDMPFVLAGARGTVRTGRLHNAPNAPHAGLLTAIARTLGADVPSFGQSASGPLGGLLG